MIKAIQHWLNVAGYMALGIWTLQFIYYAYIKKYELKDWPRQTKNYWDLL